MYINNLKSGGKTVDKAYLSIVQTGLSRMSSIFTREPTNSRILLIPYIIIAGL